MKIAILTQYYPPEIGAPQIRLSELVTGLAKRGHEVSILTAMPNYPQGRIYPGFGGLIHREYAGDTKIIRTWIYSTQSIEPIRRLTSYFSFVFSSLLLGGWFLPRQDYLMTESPPLFLGIAGFVLSRWKRARWIFNVSDLWPQSAVRLGVVNSGLALNISYGLERFCYTHAWRVTGQSAGILKDISQRFPMVKTFHLSNGVDTTRFRPGSADADTSATLRSGARIVALYAGLHGLAQGLDQVIAAAQLMQSDDGFRFVLIGDGPEKKALVEKSAELGLRNIVWGSPQPSDRMPAILVSADIALITLKTDIPGAVPSKLYEAMATGLPIVLAASGEAADIVRRTRAGIVVTPGDTPGLVHALRNLSQDPSLRCELGANGRLAATKEFNRTTIVSRFAEFLESS